MDIPGLIRTVALPIIRDVAGSTRAQVKHEAVTGSNRYGPLYEGPIIIREALIEDRSEPVAGLDGTERLSTAKLTFFEHVTVDERDRFTLPDGKVWNVMKRGGLLDENGQAYVTEVWLGKL